MKDIKVETIAEATGFQSATHMWNVVTISNPIAAGMVADLTEEQRVAVRQASEATTSDH